MYFPRVVYVDFSVTREESVAWGRRELKYILIIEGRRERQINKDKQRSNRSFGIWEFLFVCLFILFICPWLCWVFVAVHRLSLVAASGGYTSLRCTGLPPRWLLPLRSTGSRCMGFSSCSTWAQ